MIHQVLVPPLGQTTATVALVKWYKTEGESVTEGEPLFSIETDKATLDIEAQASGILRDVAAIEGQEVDVLSAIATIVPPEMSRATVPAAVASPAERPVAPSAPQPAPPASAPIPAGASRVFASPRARQRAGAEGVRLDPRAGAIPPGLSGSGPDGAIVERDVIAYIQRLPIPAPTPAAQPVAPAANPPACTTLTSDVDAGALVDLQRRLAQRGITATCADILVCAISRAASAVPVLARSGHVDIGLGDVSRPPVVIREAESMSLARLAQERTKDAAPGNASLVFIDLGAYRIDTLTTPFASANRAVVCAGRIRPQPGAGGARVWLSLSADPALLDLPTALGLLNAIVERVEDPTLMLI